MSRLKGAAARRIGVRDYGTGTTPHEAVANRSDIGCAAPNLSRRAARPGSTWTAVDVDFHRRIGTKRLAVRTLLDITDTAGWGGVLMLVSKRAWHRAGGFVDGMMCVDHNFHFNYRAAGGRLYLIEGLYVYHHRWTSAQPGAWKENPKAECPCRGMTAPEPRDRIHL